MSDFLWSRQAFFAGASSIDLLVFAIVTLVLGAGALAAWRAWTAPPLPIRWWEPVPDHLERAEGAYGAAALKEVYPGALRRGVTSAGAVHIVLAIVAMIALALAPKPERRVIIRIPPEPPTDPTLTEVVPIPRDGGGGTPILQLPDPRNVIPTTLETHVAMADLDDLAAELIGSSEGSLFGDGFGDDTAATEDSGRPGRRGLNGLADPGPRDVVPVDELPELVWMAEPRYPEMARLAGLEGVVELRLLVDTDGRVRKSRIDRSIAGLDEAALAAAATARFRPALWQGRPVKVWVSLPIRFSLH
jgi:TonB family protein